MSNLHVLLLFGGESPEHEVSLASAKNVYAAIDKDKYTVTLCYITKNGVWRLVDTVRKATNEDPALEAVLGKKQFKAGEKTIKPDVILPILHGSGGEDGTIQGFGRLMHIPVAGPSLTSSVVAMDKDITKKLLTAANLPVVDWVVLHASTIYPSYEVMTKQLGEVLFVKPAGAGSSVGVSKVTTKDEYEAALGEAFTYDHKIIIESAIEKARELEVAVLGNDQPQATLPGEIIPGEEFYSYEDKYNDASTAVVQAPAELEPETAEAIRNLALQAYRAIEGRGMARVDFFLNKDGQIYVNEINTIPGFTNISMYPKLWQHEGLGYPELIDALLQLALET